MHPLSLLGHLLELHASALQSREAPDALAQRFFAERRYLGSRDRAWLGNRLWTLLRGRLRAEALLAQLSPELAAVAVQPIPAALAPSLLHFLLLRAASPAAAADSAASPADPLTLPADELGPADAVLSSLQGHQQARDPQNWPPPAPGWPQAAEGLTAWLVEELPGLLSPTGAAEPLTDAASALASGLPGWMWGALRATLAAMDPPLPAELSDPLVQAQALLREPPLGLRVNTRKGTRAELLTCEALRQAGAVAGALSPEAIIVPRRLNLGGLPEWRRGAIEVQDEGSQLIGAAAWPLLAEARARKAEVRVLDACAGGGGKALHLAALGGDAARIMATDVRPDRLAELDERARRAGARVHLKSLDESDRLRDLDLVLIDAPCSGSGTLRRRPHLLWQLTPERVAGYAHTQLGLLRHRGPQVRPGGLLLYATCSLFSTENDEVIERFLAEQRGFRQLDPLAAWQAWAAHHGTPCDARLEWGRTRHGRQLLPGVQGCDGFYIACLRKTNA